MTVPTKKPKLAVEDIDQIKEDIRDIRNDIDKMKGDTHNMVRIMNLANAQQIEDDLTRLVGSSENRAAILELTKEEITRTQLAQTLGMDPRNLNRFLDPFLDKGYVASIKHGKQLSYRRAESVDLIGIEEIDRIWTLVQAWRTRMRIKLPEQAASSSNSEIQDSGARSEESMQSSASGDS